MAKYLPWLIGCGVVYYLWKRSKSSLGSPELTGLGVGGRPRMGRPKTLGERAATHERLFGSSEVPVRGTGLYRRGII